MTPFFHSNWSGPLEKSSSDRNAVRATDHTPERATSAECSPEQAGPLNAVEQVYFFNCQGANAIKIGRSDDPEARMRACQTGCPLQLTLLGSIPGDLATERTLHSRFESLRIQGEWFRSAPELLDFIGEALARRAGGCDGSRLPMTFEHRGEYRSLEEWCRRMCLHEMAVLGLMVDGMSFAEAIRHPRSQKARPA